MESPFDVGEVLLVGWQRQHFSKSFPTHNARLRRMFKMCPRLLWVKHDQWAGWHYNDPTDIEYFQDDFRAPQWLRPDTGWPTLVAPLIGPRRQAKVYVGFQYPEQSDNRTDAWRHYHKIFDKFSAGELGFFRLFRLPIPPIDADTEEED